MKIEFRLQISGEDSIYTKFCETLQNNNTLDKDLAHCFAQTIVLAFKLRAEDKLQLDGFYAGKIEEPADKVKCTWKENDLSPEVAKEGTNTVAQGEAAKKEENS